MRSLHRHSRVCALSSCSRIERLAGGWRSTDGLRTLFYACTLVLPLFALSRVASGAEKPSVRAITAFVRLDHAKYVDQVEEALDSLRRARAAFEKAGFQVQSIRITTQPFPEYIRNLSDSEALRFFQEYDSLAKKEHFGASLGPAMSSTNDNAHYAELLSAILLTTDLNGSIIVAGEDGIHGDAVVAAAKLIKYVSANTPRSEGNFRFAATALVPSNAPFYPGSYHTGAGHEFTIGLETAGVVRDALAASTWDRAAAKERLMNLLGGYARRVDEIARSIESETGW
jgi:uncharacterized protein (UPF0210 family)